MGMPSIKMTYKERNRQLRRIINSYHIQFKAAMRATSLGLCKRIIKHALEDERKIRRRNEM